jgi:hypothetical protein
MPGVKMKDQKKKQKKSRQQRKKNLTLKQKLE